MAKDGHANAKAGRGDGGGAGVIDDTAVARAAATATLRHAAIGVRKATARVAAVGTTGLRPSPPSKMTTARRKLFLETLAATCNVTLSAAAAGVAVRTARNLRYKDAEFSALWDTALAAGRERLREDLFAYALGHRSSGENPDDCDLDAPATVPFDPHLAVKVLSMNDGSDGLGRRRGGPAAAPSQAEVDALLLRRLEALARSRA